MKKYLSLLVASSFAFYMQACSDSTTSADDDEIENVSSSSDDDASSSSKAKSSSSKVKSSSSKAKSSSSKVKSSSSKAKSSSSKAKSSSSKAKSSSSKVKSSSSKAKSSSSVVKSSSSVVPSSSSVVKSSSSEAISSSSESVISAYVFGSDYTSGEIRWLVDGKISKESLQFNQDSRVVALDGKLFVLERYGADNIVLVDPTTKEVKWQQSFAADDNPGDVVKANDNEVWVSLEGPNKFVKVSVADGKVTKTVETSDFAKAAGQSANLVDFETRNDTLFALFRRGVAGWPAGYPDPGLLALYKLNDGTLLDTIRLAKFNPVSMSFVKGDLYVASTGAYDASGATQPDENRGIEKVDFAQKKSSVIVDGTKLGGGIYAFAVDEKNGVAYAAIYNSYGNVPLVQVNLSAKTVTTVSGVNDAEGSVVFDAKAGVLYVGDRSYGAEAVYSYKSGVLAKVETASADVLPPYSITIAK